MDKKAIYDLFYAIPASAKYADDLDELDDADIPRDRIPKLVAQMKGEDQLLAFMAARVLCCWADERGFEYLREFVMREQLTEEGWYPHRLRNYDETCRIVLNAFIKYWAKKSDESEALGDVVRQSLLEPIGKIIKLSNSQGFEISHLFYLMEDYGFTEYLPALKEHLQAIIQNPAMHHWKIADCAHLLVKFDPAFVESTLAACGKTLADFPNK